MGMSTNIVGFIDLKSKPKYNEMLEVFQACEKAEIPVPVEVREFFHLDTTDTNPETDPGIEIEIENSKAVSEWNGEYQEGFEVNLTLLPEGVTVIRFFNSY